MNQLSEQKTNTTENTLEVELKTFEELKPKLLGTDRGRYAVIHGKEFAGCWDTWNDAIQTGYMKFGNVPLLVKQVLEVEPAIQIYSLSQAAITRGGEAA